MICRCFFRLQVSISFRRLHLASKYFSDLKIHRWRQRTGSSPVTGTKKENPDRGFSFLVSRGDGLEPIQMQQSGGLLPPGVSAGCSIVRSSPAAGTIAQNPWFSRVFWLFSFQFSRSGEKEVLTDLRRRFLGITGEAIPIFCPRQDFFTNSLPFLSGFFQQDSLK